MKVFKWLKANIWAVVVALVAALGAGIFWSYHRGKVRSLEIQGAVEKAHSRVSALDAERIALEERREENSERIAELVEEKTRIQTELVSLEADVKEMSNGEIERAFQDMY